MWTDFRGIQIWEGAISAAINRQRLQTEWREPSGEFMAQTPWQTCARPP